MPSRRQRRFARRASAQQKRAGEDVSVQPPSPDTKPTPTDVSQVSQVEPKILKEDIGKLVDIGVDQKMVDRLLKAGFPGVRDAVVAGKAKLRGIWGMKAHYGQFEAALQAQGVTIPA